MKAIENKSLEAGNKTRYFNCVAEQAPEPQGAASFGLSRSRNAVAPAPMALAPIMVLNMVRNRKITQNITVYNPFSSYFQQYKS
jgi:hypothetical protein